MGSKTLEKKTQRKFKLNDMTCKLLVQYLERKTSSQYELMYYITAERNVDAIMYRRAFYEILEKNGFRCDIRNFKGK